MIGKVFFAQTLLALDFSISGNLGGKKGHLSIVCSHCPSICCPEFSGQPSDPLGTGVPPLSRLKDKNERG